MPRYSRFGGDSNEEFYKLIKEYVNKGTEIEVAYIDPEVFSKNLNSPYDSEKVIYTSKDQGKFYISGEGLEDTEFGTIDDFINFITNLVQNSEIYVINNLNKKSDDPDYTIKSIDPVTKQDNTDIKRKINDPETIAYDEEMVETLKFLLQKAINENDTTMIERYKRDLKNREEYVQKRKKQTASFGKRRSSKGKASSVNADIAYLQSI